MNYFSGVGFPSWTASHSINRAVIGILPRMQNIFGTIFAVSFLSGCAVSYDINPVASAQQTLRYDQGTPTLFADQTKGSIELTPLRVNKDGRLLFMIVAFNKSDTPADFGIENITSFDTSNTPLKIYSRGELAREARVSAEWQQFAAVALGAAAAYAANESAYRTTTGYVATPTGTATFSATTYDPTAATLGIAAAGAATGYTLSSIEHNMDAQLDHLNGVILQTTTIDAGSSNGGEVIVDMPKGHFPQRISLQTNWNGEPYLFEFLISQAK